MCTCLLPNIIDGCVSKPDWVKIIQLVEGCGIACPEWYMHRIKEGNPTPQEVIVGFQREDGIPFLKIEVGHRSYYQVHPEGTKAIKTVKDLIATIFPPIPIKEEERNILPQVIRHREYPCSSCDEGEYQYKETAPGYSQSSEIYECNCCGHEISFP